MTPPFNRHTRGMTILGRPTRAPDVRRVQQIMEMMDKAGGPGAWMRARELEQGGVLIKPGSQPWFPAEDWPSENQIVAVRNHEVRLVAVIAAKPRCGAFGRLCRGIVDSDMTPVVIQPIMREMVEILERWRWCRCYVRRNGETEEQWRPGHDWMMATVRKNKGAGDDGQRLLGDGHGGDRGVVADSVPGDAAGGDQEPDTARDTARD